VKESLLQLFSQHPQLAIAISLLASILIAIAGILPSVFITAANILFFGFWPGLFLSFAGEALGAIVAFMLYRKGLKKGLAPTLDAYPRAKRLVDAEGREAFSLIFSLRLLPFVPSGLITFAAAVGKVSAGLFFIASSLGKLPALFIEAASVYGFTRFGLGSKILLAAAGIAIAAYVIKRILSSR